MLTFKLQKRVFQTRSSSTSDLDHVEMQKLRIKKQREQLLKERDEMLEAWRRSKAKEQKELEERDKRVQDNRHSVSDSQLAERDRVFLEEAKQACEFRKQQEEVRKTMFDAERVCSQSYRQLMSKVFRDAVQEKRLRDQSALRRQALAQANKEEEEALRSVRYFSSLLF